MNTTSQTHQIVLSGWHKLLILGAVPVYHNMDRNLQEHPCNMFRRHLHWLVRYQEMLILEMPTKCCRPDCNNSRQVILPWLSDISGLNSSCFLFILGPSIVLSCLIKFQCRIDINEHKQLQYIDIIDIHHPDNKHCGSIYFFDPLIHIKLIISGSLECSSNHRNNCGHDGRDRRESRWRGCTASWVHSASSHEPTKLSELSLFFLIHPHQ